ncbi:hypothetical protein B0J17DRAFT_632297 [Rhizoctonia solani]|nr:hypothetical protein B0J17DRAFT_632297 [Rhizoctonia solani]
MEIENNKKNPQSHTSNCVYVTLAQLVKMDYDPFMTRYGFMNVEPDTNMAVSMDFLEALLGKMRTLGANTKYEFQELFSANSLLTGIPHSGNFSLFKMGEHGTWDSIVAPNLGQKWGVDCLGFLYYRPDGTGHSIVCRKLGDGWALLDYQKDPYEIVDPGLIRPVAVYSAVH